MGITFAWLLMLIPVLMAATIYGLAVYCLILLIKALKKYLNS